jgi:short-subunit dehydrogenase
MEKYALQRRMEIEVYSLLEIFKAFLPRMAKNKYGKIVVMLTACTKGIPPKYLSDVNPQKNYMYILSRTYI